MYVICRVLDRIVECENFLCYFNNKFSLTKILTPDWNPIFALSNFLFKLNFFIQNCLAILSIDKTDSSAFIRLIHAITRGGSRDF